MSIGRNDACFCGSGNKYKKCHGDINDFSTIAKLIIYFKELDAYIMENTKGRTIKCKKGCSHCCSDFFRVSLQEMILILRYIHVNRMDEEYFFHKASTYNHNLAKKHSEYYKLLEYTPKPNEKLWMLNDIRLMPKKFDSCIYLDEVSQECMVYEVRPDICRKHGVLQSVGNVIICDILSKCNDVSDHLVPEKRMFEKYQAVSNYVYQGKIVSIRQYPLSYYYKFVFKESTSFKEAIKNPKFGELLTIPSEDYIDKLMAGLY